jgi:hypothetical protein
MGEYARFICVRFQVLTAASMKLTVFWDVALCSLVEVYRRFRGAYSLHHQGVALIMVMMANIYQTSLHNILEDSNLLGFIWLGIKINGGFCEYVHETSIPLTRGIS